MQDFFTENHWKKLPVSWAQALDLLSPEELGNCIINPNNCGKNTHKHVLPLSLLAFKETTRTLALNRTSIGSLDQVVSYLSHCGFSSAMQQNPDWISPSSAKKPSGALGSLSQVFHRCVKPKKQHELYRMGQCCATISQVTKCKTVVDVGAGVGHLSRFLSYGHGLNLICLESVEKLGSSAIQLDSKLEEACKRLGISNISTPQHINLTLSPYTNNLMEILRSRIPETPVVGSVGIIGLHTCMY